MLVRYPANGVKSKRSGLGVDSWPLRGVEHTTSSIARKGSPLICMADTPLLLRVTFGTREHTVALHLFDDQGYKSVDRFVKLFGIEGVGDRRPNEDAIRIGNKVQVGLDTNFLLLAQIVGG